MTRLSVNLNKIALVRNARPLAIPGVVHMARLALGAGAHGITVHPRPDARHIRSDDVYALSALLRDDPAHEFNIEGNPFHNVMELVRAVRPQQCTLVPDDPGAPTSDHGWDLARDGERLPGERDDARGGGGPARQAQGVRQQRRTGPQQRDAGAEENTAARPCHHRAGHATPGQLPGDATGDAGGEHGATHALAGRPQQRQPAVHR